MLWSSKIELMSQPLCDVQLATSALWSPHVQRASTMFMITAGNARSLASKDRFRSCDLWVMSPSRFHCATLLLCPPLLLGVLRSCKSPACCCCCCCSCVFLGADLFAILKCTEKLERAYVRDGIAAKDYEAQCEKLIAQFRMLWGSMKEMVRGGRGQLHTCVSCIAERVRVLQYLSWWLWVLVEAY